MVVEDMSVMVVAEAIKFVFPAYCANAAPVVFGGGVPLDLDKSFLDGKPVFGRNKTIRGFFSGLAVGTLVGFAESVLFQYGVLLGFVTSLGALLGDLAESFFKRRLGIPSGATLPVADQLDFVLGALLFSLIVSPPPPLVALTVLIITPPLHLLTNYIAYVLGLKRTPW